MTESPLQAYHPALSTPLDIAFWFPWISVGWYFLNKSWPDHSPVLVDSSPWTLSLSTETSEILMMKTKPKKALTTCMFFLLSYLFHPVTRPHFLSPGFFCTWNGKSSSSHPDTSLSFLTPSLHACKMFLCAFCLSLLPLLVCHLLVLEG